ncbi:C-X-C chemokine receptor type 3 [Nibea albiflora]|uniref:C-X-C chemokine receptor type 3 n=1 Tax=Nibea albiflora TaxID=240163 RepID=A0ACB7FA64_NIBAL|nr:C-X-C chemokine receptor type 3 [Nibea albiflora]
MSMPVELDGLFRTNTTYDYDDNYEYKDDLDARGSKTVLIPLLYYVELVIGLLGNGLLLAVLAQKRRSWSISDTFVIHLCVADVLLLATLPFWAAQATQHCEWCFSGFLCKICGAVFNINFYCGILLLGCICLDRYLSIVHVNRLYSQNKHRLVHVSCLLVWILSLILTIPDWIFAIATKESEKTLCAHKYPQSATDWQLVSRLLHHMVGFLMPTAALVMCCSCVLLRLQSSTKGIQKQRFSAVILPLVAVFFLCWMPYNITLIVDTIRSSSKEPNDRNPEGSLKTALMVTSGLGCAHACLRPLLYLALCLNFRKQTLAVLKCATLKPATSLWELGVSEEVPSDQSHEGKEMGEMMSVDQAQSTQCA